MKTRKFRKKYYVIKSKVSVSNADRYPMYSSIDWTNVVFIGLIEEFYEAKISK